MRHEGENRLSRCSITDSVGFVGLSRRDHVARRSSGRCGRRGGWVNGHRVGGWPRSVLLLQASERRELAPASGVGLEHPEDVYDLRGAQSAFDRVFDVGEGEGWVAEMRPAQGLFEEDDPIEVAFEEGAIEAIQIRMC